MIVKPLNHFINQINDKDIEFIMDYRNTYPTDNTVKVMYQMDLINPNKYVFNVYCNNIITSISWVCGLESGDESIFYVTNTNPQLINGVTLTVKYLNNENPLDEITYTNTYYPLNILIPLPSLINENNILFNDSHNLFIYNSIPVKGINKINKISHNIKDLDKRKCKITFTDIQDGDYIKLNDYYIYFKVLALETNDIQIGMTLNETMTNLIDYLDNSSNIEILDISYTLNLNTNSEYDLIFTQNATNNINVLCSASFNYTQFIRLNDYTLELSISHDISNINSLTYIDINNNTLINSTFFNPLNINQKLYYIFKISHVQNYGALIPSDELPLEYELIKSFYFADINISAEYNMDICDGTAHRFDKSGQCTVFAPKDSYKVFGITGFNVKSYGVTNDRYLNIKFRYSLTNGQLWSDYMILNNTNLSNIPFSGLKFFKIEFMICREGSDNTGYILLYGIDLLGDVQNVTKDYLTLSNMGIVCAGKFIGDNACTDSINITGVGDYNSIECCDDELFNPYQMDGMLSLYKDLSNTVNKMFGFEVDYFKTTSDVNGTDTYLHEYQLFHRQNAKKLKILVPENNFPEDRIQMNHFDFGLLDVFEVHITKDEFKRVFGVESQPERNDHLLFCDVNRMYQVESAQPVRVFLNTSIYYRVTLVKYDDKKNIKSDSIETETAINELTGKNGLNALFGIENKQEEEKIVKPKQNKPNSIDKLRMNINGNIKYLSEQIFNGSVIISESQYDMSGISYDTSAITYNFKDNVDSGNRAIMFWFNFNDLTNDNYGFINNYDETNSLGYKLNMINKSFTFKYNTQNFNVNINNILEKGKWYCLLLNINTQNNNIEFFFYKRKFENSNYSNTADIDLVYKKKFATFNPAPFVLPDDKYISFNGFNGLMTNFRVFNQIVTDDVHPLVLNRLIVKDEQYLIVGDNCNKKFNIRNYPSKNFNMDK